MGFVDPAFVSDFQQEGVERMDVRTAEVRRRRQRLGPLFGEQVRERDVAPLSHLPECVALERRDKELVSSATQLRDHLPGHPGVFQFDVDADRRGDGVEQLREEWDSLVAAVDAEVPKCLPVRLSDQPVRARQPRQRLVVEDDQLARPAPLDVDLHHVDVFDRPLDGGDGVLRSVGGTAAVADETHGRSRPGVAKSPPPRDGRRHVDT